MAKQQDCSLFVVGSTQKKRPHNLVLGRTFDGHVLDMFETGVEDYKGMREFKSEGLFSCDMKPILMFQGEPFELSEVHRRIKNLFQGKYFNSNTIILFLDFFKLCDA
jgi:ribosome production factor 2